MTASRTTIGWTVAGALLLFAMTAATYVPSLSCGYVWDDGAYIAKNAPLQSLEGLRRTWFELGATQQNYPLVYTSFWLEYRVWGLNPAGSHALNVLLHALNAILLWRVLRRLAVPGAWVAAAIFAVHPVHVESVTWIAERKNVLSGAFYLSAALVYLTTLSPPAEPRRGSWKPYALATLLFVGALLSKTITASLPVALAAVLWWKRRELRRADTITLSLMLVLGVASGLLTVWLERHHVGAAGQHWTLPWSARPLLAGRAIWFYLVKLTWPHPLIFIYPRWAPDPSRIADYVPLLAAAGVVAALWRHRARVGRGVLTGVFYYLVTLAPALGFFDVYFMRFSFCADHFNYLGSIGPIALAAAGATWLVRDGPRARKVAACGLAILLAALAGLAWRQQSLYRDEETLWRGTIARNPAAFLAHNNLAGILLRRGAVAEAEGHLEAALRVEPTYAHALCNLGEVRRHQGRTDEAVALYRQALAVDPKVALAHNNLGAILLQRGRTDEAGEHFEAAVQVKPDYADALDNLGQVRHRQGRLDEAVAHCREALRYDPSRAGTYNTLGIVLAAQGKLEDAITQLNEAVRLNPRLASAQYNLGIAQVATGALAEGIAHLEHAARLEPTDRDVADALADARARLAGSSGPQGR